ncbi:MAG: nucleoside-diphosphate sugar epimerase/dehydratase, partial [Pseudomonadota bacterium]
MSNVGDDRASFGQLLRLALLRLDRRSKQGVMGATDATLGGLCAIAAIWVTGAAPVFSTVSLAQIAMVGAAAALVAVPVNIYFGLYRSVVRFLGADLFVAGTKAAVSLTVIVFAVAAFATNFADPFRIAFAFCPLAAISICGSRLLARLFLNRRQLDPERVVIYGAGAGGVRLASALAAGEHYLPVAFVDDSRPLWGKVVGGLEVYPATQIKRVIDRIGASRVLLALPSVSRRRRRRILERLVDMPVHVQTMPDVADIVAGRARVDDIREVDVEDLLGRDAVPPNPALLNACISDKSVMVTGAGGSIGSELCRQMLALSPKVLVIFDQSEPALYDVCRQLTRLVSGNEKSCKIVPLLGSVCDRRRVREVMQAYGVQTVYHAAAYKHVPIVEQNLVDGVRNNALGTLHTAQAAIDADVETFVLISTDKAVSPTNVMGASKRFAELILQAIHRNNSQVRFCMVRFGNVLDSAGSVVPLFRQQIRDGGPVTVTHPEMSRYFMTIPEA